MGKKRYPNFKVYSDSGKVIWFNKKIWAEQYIRSHSEVGVHYGIIEFGANNGKKKKENRPKAVAKRRRPAFNTQGNVSKKLRVEKQSITTNPIEQRKKNSWLEIADELARSNPET